MKKNEEIEFKFLILDKNTENKLINFIEKTFFFEKKPSFWLQNDYFDTKNFDLAKNHSVLRIRAKNQSESYEMTFKSAQNVQGAGLHKNIEFNVLLFERKLDISRFPKEFFELNFGFNWDNDFFNIFSTNFNRQTWLVSYRESQIELAIDFGEIIANNQMKEIYELEIELKSGKEDDLFSFAQHFLQFDGLRLGTKSKAKRACLMLNKTEDKPFDAFESFSLEHCNFRQALSEISNIIQNVWENLESRWIENDDPHAIYLAIVFMQQFLVLFGRYFSNDFLFDLNEKLMNLKRILLSSVDFNKESLVYSSDYLQMRFKAWLFFYESEKNFSSLINPEHLNETDASFLDISLSLLDETYEISKLIFSLPMKKENFLETKEISLSLICRFYLLSGLFAEKAQETMKKGFEFYLQLDENDDENDLNAQRNAFFLLQPFWQN